MTNLNGKRIVLIGGAGFIGHNLALVLKEAGAVVEIIDNLQINNLLTFAACSYQEDNRDRYFDMINERFQLLRQARISLEVQDARDYHALSRLLSQFDPDVIIQLAAVAHAGKSNKDPHSTFDHSLRTLENALDWARNHDVHFIYFSSSMVYGNFESDAVSEDTVCDPIGIYGALKFAGEKFVIAYNQVFDLTYTIVRPSALYGERCVSRRVGQVFIENAMQDKPVIIHGTGDEALDFTYIGDLIQGIMKIIENESSRNQIFNLTYGESRTIQQMAAIVMEHFPDVTIEYRPKKAFMPNRGTLCVDKARKMLRYIPRYPLERGFVKYINWYREQEK